MAKRNKKFNLIYGVITIITIIALSFIGEKVSSDNIGNLANEVNAGANEIANVENNVADNTENKIYVLVEGPYDLNWVKTSINLLGKSNEFIVLPSGGCGNINHLCKKQ